MRPACCAPTSTAAHARNAPQRQHLFFMQGLLHVQLRWTGTQAWARGSAGLKQLSATVATARGYMSEGTAIAVQVGLLVRSSEWWDKVGQGCSWSCAHQSGVRGGAQR